MPVFDKLKQQGFILGAGQFDDHIINPAIFHLNMAIGEGFGEFKSGLKKMVKKSRQRWK